MAPHCVNTLMISLSLSLAGLFRWSAPPSSTNVRVLRVWGKATVSMLMLLNMRGWPCTRAPSPARVSSLQASSSGNAGGSGAACHILAHGDATTWLCDEEAASCVETQQMVLCTEPNDGMHCVLQEGLAIEGKPVWACAPILESREAPQRSRLHMSLVRRGDA